MRARRGRGVVIVVALTMAACSSGADSEPADSVGGTAAEAATTSTAAEAATTTVVDPEAPGPANVAGRRDHVIEVGGQARELITYTPEAAVGQVAPVVLVLHGTSGDGQRFFDISGWVELADAEGVIVAFPSALTHCFHEDENRDGDLDDDGEQNVTTKWNAGQFDVQLPLCTPEEVAALPPVRRALADHPPADDLAFVDEILGLLAAEFSVDTSRIYVTGFSNGGQMSARLAAERSNRFAAVAVAAGTLVVDVPPPAAPTSIMYTVGADDDLFLAFTGGISLPTDESALDVPLIQRIRDDLLATTGLVDQQLTYETRTGSTPLGPFVRFTWGPEPGESATLDLVVFGGLMHRYPAFFASRLWEYFAARRLSG